jgi:2-dehydro-3-deoxygluconokinase
MQIKARTANGWDEISLGEVMLRLDPGEGRIHTTRSFQVWEGGGEYNVARGLRRCFGYRTAVVTALVDNPVGRLLEDLMLQGGVDTSLLSWVADDGVGRAVRNGLNFTERGFGPRAARGCSDRGNSAASQMQAGQIDWNDLFAKRGARWFHTGGIYAALSPSTAQVTREAMQVARKNNVRVSYDLNYRPSLWKANGGQPAARSVNRELMPLVDVLFGNEEDFSTALGYELSGIDHDYNALDTAAYRRMIERIVKDFPNIKLIATSLRSAHSANQNSWGGICWSEGDVFEVPQRDILILDRVGGGDSFATGLIHGLLSGESVEWALQCAVAHGALAMSTPGDTTMASVSEVLKAMNGGSARIER